MLQAPKDYEGIDKLFVWHPFTQMADWEMSDNIVIESAKGVYLKDINGKEYIDGVSSLWCNVHGHQKKKIDDAIRKQLRKVAHSTMLGLSHVPGVALAEKLIELAPEGLCKVFYSDSGSTAVEVALKMAYQFWQQKRDTKTGKHSSRAKKKFLTFSNAYHGDTIGSVSLGGIPLFNQVYEPLLFDVFRVPYPEFNPEHPELEAARFQQIEKRVVFSAQDLAAIVVEPLVQGAAGMRVSSPNFLRLLSGLCQRHGILLIVDEVATGFGRTGTMFACQQAGVAPDILCVAKGLTGGYLPLAATLTSDYIYHGFLGAYKDSVTFFHGHTYGGNPLACAAALANLEIFESEKTLIKLQSKIPLLQAGLENFRKLKHVAEIRSCGFMVGIELMEDPSKNQAYAMEQRMGHKVCLKARELGVLIRPLGDVIVLMPPLSIENKDLQKLLKITYAAIKAVTEAE